MASRLVSCAFGPSTVVALREAVEAAKGDDPLAPVVLVVPTDRLGVSARRAPARGGVGERRGIAGISVLTLRRLAETVATATLAEGGRRPVTEAVLVSVLDRLLHEDPRLFAPVADHPESSRFLARAHRDLRLLTPQVLARVAATTPVAADVVRLHHATVDLLAPGHYDEVDLLVRAAELLGDGHIDLPPVVIHLPGQPDPPVAAFVAALARHTSVTAIVGLSGAEADRRVLDAWRALLGEPDGPTEVVAPVADRVLAATDADDEVRAVVRDVVARLAAGTPPGTGSPSCTGPVTRTRGCWPSTWRRLVSPSTVEGCVRRPSGCWAGPCGVCSRCRRWSSVATRSWPW